MVKPTSRNLNVTALLCYIPLCKSVIIVYVVRMEYIKCCISLFGDCAVIVSYSTYGKVYPPLSTLMVYLHPIGCKRIQCCTNTGRPGYVYVM